MSIKITAIFLIKSINTLSILANDCFQRNRYLIQHYNRWSIRDIAFLICSIVNKTAIAYVIHLALWPLNNAIHFNSVRMLLYRSNSLGYIHEIRTHYLNEHKVAIISFDDTCISVLQSKNWMECPLPPRIQ